MATKKKTGESDTGAIRRSLRISEGKNPALYKALSNVAEGNQADRIRQWATTGVLIEEGRIEDPARSWLSQRLKRNQAGPLSRELVQVTDDAQLDRLWELAQLGLLLESGKLSVLHQGISQETLAAPVSAAGEEIPLDVFNELGFSLA